MTAPRAAVLGIVLAFTAARCSTGRHGGTPAVSSLTVAGLDSALASHRGSVTMVHVWATWCAPCLEELPRLADLAAEFSDSGFAMILVSADDPGDVDSLVVPALRRAGVGFASHIYTGRDQDAFIRFLKPGWSGAMPASFLYSRTGRLEKWFYGERTGAAYVKEIRTMLHE